MKKPITVLAMVMLAMVALNSLTTRMAKPEATAVVVEAAATEAFFSTKPAEAVSTNKAQIVEFTIRPRLSSGSVSNK